MRTYFLILLLSHLFLYPCLTQGVLLSKPSTESIDVPTFGEELRYHAYWSFFKIAELTSQIDAKSFFVGGKHCYKIDLSAKTASLLGMFADINELFGTYIDTQTLLPTKSYRFLKESKYTHDEVSDYHYEEQKVVLSVYDKDKGVFEEKGSYAIHTNTFDLVGAYVHLRSIDWINQPLGSVLHFNLFIENALYPLSCTLLALEEIKVKAGKYKAFKISLSLPNSGLFTPKQPLIFWLRADTSKVLLKAEGKLSFGRARIELQSLAQRLP